MLAGDLSHPGFWGGALIAVAAIGTLPPTGVTLLDIEQKKARLMPGFEIP